MAFSIGKLQKIQVLRKNETFSSHPTEIAPNFHKPTSLDVIARYALEVTKTLRSTGSIEGVSKRIWYNPNDWYGVPKINTLVWLKKWMGRTWLNAQEFDDEEALMATLQKSISLAQSYLARKWYYLPKALHKVAWGSAKEILWMVHGMSKYTNEVDIRSSTMFLKVVRTFFKVITTKDSQWNLMFNPLTGEIQEKDKTFAKELMKFFNSDSFTYEKWASQLWPRSTIAQGRTKSHGTDAAFTATVDFKTLDSQVLKTISQNEYDAAEALKDKNRMQIQVKSKADMLKVALVMIESWLLKKGVTWEQKWWLFSEETQEWNDFQRSYVRSVESISSLLKQLPKEKSKGNTKEREELKITAANPSFEIQIVLEWNNNENGWNANPYYKMKADIDEEIMLRAGYITKDRILKHITRRIPDLEKFWQSPKDKTPQSIFEHFVKEERKLIPLYEQDYTQRKGASPDYRHTKFFTNRDFTSRWIKVYSEALPFKTWNEVTGKFDALNTPSSPSNS